MYEMEEGELIDEEMERELRRQRRLRTVEESKRTAQRSERRMPPYQEQNSRQSQSSEVDDAELLRQQLLRKMQEQLRKKDTETARKMSTTSSNTNSPISSRKPNGAMNTWPSKNQERNRKIFICRHKNLRKPSDPRKESQLVGQQQPSTPRNTMEQQQPGIPGSSQIQLQSEKPSSPCVDQKNEMSKLTTQLGIAKQQYGEIVQKKRDMIGDLKKLQESLAVCELDLEHKQEEINTLITSIVTMCNNKMEADTQHQEEQQTYQATTITKSEESSTQSQPIDALLNLKKDELEEDNAHQNKNASDKANKQHPNQGQSIALEMNESEETTASIGVASSSIIQSTDNSMNLIAEQYINISEENMQEDECMETEIVPVKEKEQNVALAEARQQAEPLDVENALEEESANGGINGNTNAETINNIERPSKEMIPETEQYEPISERPVEPEAVQADGRESQNSEKENCVGQQNQQESAEEEAVQPTLDSFLMSIHAYRLSPNFPQRLIAHPAISNRLNPFIPLCPYQLNGRCADHTCPFQHEEEYTLSEQQIIEEIINYWPRLCPPKIHPSQYAASLLKGGSLEQVAGFLISSMPDDVRRIHFGRRPAASPSHLINIHKPVPNDDEVEYDSIQEKALSMTNNTVLLY